MMSPQQLQALRDEIAQRVDPSVTASRNTQAIADVLSVGRTRPTMREIGNGLVLEVLGIYSGNDVLDAVASDVNLRNVRPLLEQGRLVASSELVAAWLGGLAASDIITRAQADAVIALGFEPAPVSEFEVRCACWSDNGEWLV